MLTDIFSIVLSIISLLSSGYVFHKNKLYSNYNNLINMENMLTNIQNSLTEVKASYVVFKKTPEDNLYEVYKNAYNDSIIELISFYETFCEMYYKKQIPKKIFKRKFTSEIKNIFKNYSDLCFMNTKYKYLNKFYNSIKK